MEYEVYLDKLFLLNFIMNLLCLELADLAFFRCASCRRLLLGAALGAAFYLVPFLVPGKAWCKMLGGFFLSAGGMVFAAFRVRSIRAFWNVTARLLLCSFLLGGFLLSGIRLFPGLRRLFTSLAGLIAVSVLLFWEVRRMVRKREEKGSLCRVELSGGGSKVEVTALVDTGNSLVEPISGKPVCLLDRAAYQRFLGGKAPEGFRAIPYHSVGKRNGLLAGYLIPGMRIEMDGAARHCANVYVGVSEGISQDGGGYEMILNPMVLKEEST